MRSCLDPSYGSLVRSLRPPDSRNSRFPRSLDDIERWKSFNRGRWVHAVFERPRRLLDRPAVFSRAPRITETNPETNRGESRTRSRERDEIAGTGFLVARVFEKTGLLVTPPSRRNHDEETGGGRRAGRRRKA